nr:helix-turn-helix domain-containing protein [uncultured Caproiciproducens sp.]
MKGYFVSNVMKIVRNLRLTAKSINVYLYLAECSNGKGECWPSKKTIAEDCKISVATVTRALRELEKAGMIISEPRRRNLNNGQTSNRYTVFTEPQITEPADQAAAIGTQEDKQETIQCMEAAYVQLEIPEQTFIMPENPSHEELTENTTSVPAPYDHQVIPVKGKRDRNKKISASRLLRIRIFFRLLLSQFDMPPRVNMTPQRTNSTTKVPLKQRKKEFISKLAK